ncbi:hypothetical protein HY620_02720 [Candidatus Uhrbacteria bacterium]|nr:hypothetical protein [Candidatus Uhrbacteria bacterium]
MKRIIGIAGRICSGKDAVAEYLARIYHAERIAVSDTLYAALRLFGIPEGRYAAQILSTFLREHFGQDVLEKALLQKIQRSKRETIIISSIRRPEDIVTLRERYPFKLVMIEADLIARHEWHVQRNKGRGDRVMSFTEFKERDSFETEITIDKLHSQATHVITNNGTLDHLYAKAEGAMAALERYFSNPNAAGKITLEDTTTIS